MKGIDLIKEWEGCSLDAYKDTGGVWTIGWGTTGSDVREGSSWTQEDCDMRLATDLLMFEQEIKDLVKVPLNSDQMAALTSFVYNVGADAFKESTMRRKLNQSNYEGAAMEFVRWCKDNGKIIKGLLKRRQREMLVFLSLY